MREGFVWGVSTSAYQIEGAAHEDGRTDSIWDVFARDPDRIADASTGEVACDHYHRYRRDVALMAGLGVDAYRFSIAWPRMPRGLAFYDRLVDELLAAGIDPVATLYHWDLPQALQDAGGWQSRDTAERFAEYADLVAAALGDRVKLWITLNEPVVHLIYGHLWGLHAPGLHLFDDPFPVVHHQLLGHGLAAQAVRGHGSAPVTIANSYSPAWAVGPDGTRESATEQDRAAALANDVLQNWLFTDPLLRGRYPEGVDAFPGADRLDTLVHPGDLAVISAPLDALGVNYYNPCGACAPSAGNPLPFDVRLIEGFPLTYFGWPVVPHGLTELLQALQHRYGERLPPIYVTENGAACADESMDDTDRITYLEAHIKAARSSGVDVRGFFVWSLIDNWEWAEGFTKRFGLVYVDFATQERTPKASYHWYRDHIAACR
jgi:beta-glucosidase